MDSGNIPKSEVSVIQWSPFNHMVDDLVLSGEKESKIQDEDLDDTKSKHDRNAKTIEIDGVIYEHEVGLGLGGADVLFHAGDLVFV